MTYPPQPENISTAAQLKLLCQLLSHMTLEQIELQVHYLEAISRDTGYGRVTLVLEKGNVRTLERTHREKIG